MWFARQLFRCCGSCSLGSKPCCSGVQVEWQHEYFTGMPILCYYYYWLWFIIAVMMFCFAFSPYIWLLLYVWCGIIPWQWLLKAQNSELISFQKLVDDGYILHASGNAEHKFIFGFYLFYFVYSKAKSGFCRHVLLLPHYRAELFCVFVASFYRLRKSIYHLKFSVHSETVYSNLKWLYSCSYLYFYALYHSPESFSSTCNVIFTTEDTFHL